MIYLYLHIFDSYPKINIIILIQAQNRKKGFAKGTIFLLEQWLVPQSEVI